MWRAQLCGEVRESAHGCRGVGLKMQGFRTSGSVGARASNRPGQPDTLLFVAPIFPLVTAAPPRALVVRSTGDEMIGVYSPFRRY